MRQASALWELACHNVITQCYLPPGRSNILAFYLSQIKQVLNLASPKGDDMASAEREVHAQHEASQDWSGALLLLLFFKPTRTKPQAENYARHYYYYLTLGRYMYVPEGV